MTRSHQIRVGPRPTVNKRTRHRHTGEEKAVRRKAETGLMQLPAEEHRGFQQPPETGRGKNKFPTGALSGVWSCRDPDFRLSAF